MTTMELEFVTVDVFTDRQFSGNPLAVILDASSLLYEEMQTIAAEFRYSETVFLSRPAERQHTAHVRIFTQTNELPFAGHPNIGAAFVIAARGSIFGRPARTPLLF